MITRILQNFGLFVGNDLQGDTESKFFLTINESLLNRNHCFWDNPGPMINFTNERYVVDAFRMCIENEIQSKRIIQFLGLKNYLRYRSMNKINKPWGWKDPRNILSLSVWLDVFPEAKIIYVVRNGVDVAHSLFVRQKQSIEHRITRFKKRLHKSKSKTTLTTSGLRFSAQCFSLEGCFSLWEDYVSHAERFLPIVKNATLTLRYENFLQAPYEHVQELAEFCGLQVTEDQITNDVSFIKTDRANAFLRNPSLVQFYQKIKNNPWMKLYGYSNNDNLVKSPISSR